jgi:hypothetical protein
VYTYIYENLCSSKPILNCIIDDFNSSTTSPQLDLYKLEKLFTSYRDQVYYKLKADKANPEIIDDLLSQSNTFWHSLCVLTEANLSEINETLTFEKIREICLKAQMIITDAYDAEGFVFWEKKKESL